MNFSGTGKHTVLDRYDQNCSDTSNAVIDLQRTPDPHRAVRQLRRVVQSQ